MTMVVLKFIDWMERAPAAARAGAVEPLVRTYFRRDLSIDDRDVVDATLTMLLDDPAIEVRRSLAEALSRFETAPRHMVIALADDLPVVSEPLYRRSPCLLDEELIQAIDGASQTIQVAIASRPWVSFAVSEAIAADAGLAAVMALVGNEGSDIDEIGFRSMIARFPGDPDLREALFAREDLPVAARQSLIAGLGARLTEFVVGRDWMSPRRADAVVREACDRATVGLAASAEECELTELVEHLRATGQLTTSLLLRSLCQGHVRFLEAALAMLAGMPPARVYPILAEGRQAAVRALLRKAGLPERSHAVIAVALDVWRGLDHDGEAGDRARLGRRMIERILTRYQEFRDGEADDLVAMLRRLAAEAAREAARSYVDEVRRRSASATGGERAA